MSSSSARATLPEQAPVSMPERRSFLGVVLAAAGGLVSAALAVPLVRFATFPLRDPAEAASWSDVGKIDEFRPLKEPVARVIDVKRVEGWRNSVVQNGIYVVPTENGGLKVLSSVCPHLGCAVRWIEKQDKFICPCHGGTFTNTGVHISGPPLRAMDELESKIEGGILRVRFQHFRQLVAKKERVG
jgi:menaquinol-cytochrome c reductase iron-sulfur subunit